MLINVTCADKTIYIVISEGGGGFCNRGDMWGQKKNSDLSQATMDERNGIMFSFSIMY